MTPDLIFRYFWNQVSQPNELGCREWLGRKRNARGYGYISLHGKTFATHRVAWTFVNGLIPEGLYVCHQCDNPPCCEPAHLFLGTQFDNMRDCKQKGRLSLPPHALGELHKDSKLTVAKVRKIRERKESGSSYASLAREFGVAEKSIWKVVHRESWTHVD